MNKKRAKLISVILVTLSVLCIANYSHSHSGKTDSSGGHKDNKNKSGLGSYHYHCGGNPAHLHKNGECPYSSNKSSSSSSSSSSTSTKTTSTVSTTIVATGIKINENIESMNVGKNQTLTATITPTNVSNKDIKWESSDENIATVNLLGEITANKSGIVDITATTSNGKTSTIKINIKEEPKTEPKEENINIIKTSAIIKSTDISSNIDTNNSNPIAGILAVGLVGGASYLGYKKYKSIKKK